MSIEPLLISLAACRLCRDTPKYGKPLPHEPRPVIQASTNARLCIAGQAPGVRVHASGRPFTDPSGVRLRSWLGLDEAAFYDAEKVAIVPMGHCFPGLDARGGDLPPRRECSETWRAQVFSSMPKLGLIVIIGRYALDWHLGCGKYPVMSRAVEDFSGLLAQERYPRLIALPHPSWRNSSWLKSNPWFESDLLPVLRKVVARVLE